MTKAEKRNSTGAVSGNENLGRTGKQIPAAAITSWVSETIQAPVRMWDLVEFSDLRSFDARSAWARLFTRAWRSQHRLALAGHGIPPRLAMEVLHLSQRVFDLHRTRTERSIENLSHLAIPMESPRGYHVENGLEFWFSGREFGEGHRLRERRPKNIWPSDCPEFHAAAAKLFSICESFALRIGEVLKVAGELSAADTRDLVDADHLLCVSRSLESVERTSSPSSGKEDADLGRWLSGFGASLAVTLGTAPTDEARMAGRGIQITLNFPRPMVQPTLPGVSLQFLVRLPTKRIEH